MNRRTFTHRVLPVAAFFGFGPFLSACATTQQTASERPDCPGKITCPQTGELICKDQCPLDQQEDSEQVAMLSSCCKK